MKKKIKKAFTLVELLVVIAILAILATVSIVGYNSFTKKAKVSNDTALVSQLNTLLKADSMVNGDAKTPTDALKITSEAGYDVEKLTPTTNDYEIIWNQAINQFALLDENGSVVYGEKNENANEYKNWKFVSEYNSATDYSVYLKGTEITSIPNVIHAGIDVGNNTAITTVNYANSDSKDDVRIRTNGGTLSVDASNDAVWHYGDIQNVNIKAIDNESYHEAGTVSGNLEIESGHLAIENAANVSTIIVKPTNAVKVTVTNGENVGTIVTKDLTKTTLNVPESLKPSENITDDKLNEISNFAGGLGTEKSPYLISNEKQFLKIKLFEKEMFTKPYYFTLINNIDLSNISVGSYVSKTFNGTLNGNNYNILVNPSQAYMFKYSVDNVVIENLTWTLNGSNALVFFNRYGTTAKSYDETIEKYTTINDKINLTFKNINIKGQNNNFYNFSQHNTGLLTYCQSYVEILNAEAVGGKASSNSDSYYAFTSETTNCTTNTEVSNCVVDVNLSTDKPYNAVLLGGQTESKNSVNISNFEYRGTFIGKQIGLVFANANGTIDGLSLVKFNNVKLIGSLIYTNENNSMAGITFANNKLELDGTINNGTISQIVKDNKMKLNIVDFKYNLVGAENTNVDKYVISLKLSALKFTDSTYVADLGEASTNTISFTINPGEQNLYKAKNLTKHQAVEKGLTLTENWIVSNEGIKCQFVNENNEWYLVIDYESNGYYREFKNTDKLCEASIYAFDNTNRLLHIVGE